MSIGDLESGVEQLVADDLAVDDTRPHRREPLWRSLTHGQGLVGLVLVGVIAVAGVLAPLLASYDPLAQIPGANLLGPSADHWLGTDQVNRDVASRVLYGIRISLVIAVLSVPVGAVVGGLLGLVATTHPLADVVTQRAFDIVLAFPALILGIMAAAIIGPGQVTVGVVIAAAEVPVFGRLVRTAVLTVREQPFVEAAEVIGARRWWILRTHVLPNAIESAGVQIALSLSLAVFVESAMSFIGIGVRPPEPSLGSLVADSIPNLDANYAYAVGPLVVVSLLVLGFLLIAQALGKARRS
ncbi:ABC transporter permease [Williamsia deligens]|uniref:ABC transporter permease n=1 Tax=Williamsia deligens TaxID=321325 RepID=A0ABW3G730_9NOCA|nr:ABC transporter permease [Williamsia deligens]MCP2192933.1 peptide/nickel transport system permease protein [Williamsia deligens]